MESKWQTELPHLTAIRISVSDGSFRKRKREVIHPWAWRKLQACLCDCQDILIKVKEARGEEDQEIMETTLDVPGSWPEDRPDPILIDELDLAALTKAVLDHCKRYTELLWESIEKAEDADDSRVDVDELSERHEQLESLSFYSFRTTLSDVLDMIETSGLEF